MSANTTAGRATRVAQAAGIAAAAITANRYGIPAKGSDLAVALAREVFAALPPNSDDSVFVGRYSPPGPGSAVSCWCWFEYADTCPREPCPDGLAGFGLDMTDCLTQIFRQMPKMCGGLVTGIRCDP
jgi:hypothetical protein